MAITAETRLKIVGLTVGMVGAAPGADILSELAEAVDKGMTLSNLAIAIANNPAFKTIYPAYLTNAELATNFIGALMGSEASTADKAAAADSMVAQLNAGTHRGAAMYNSITSLSAIAITDVKYGAASSALANKTDVANYFSVTTGQSASTLDGLKAVVASVTSAASTVATAKAAIDASASAGKIYNLAATQDLITGTAKNDTFFGSNTSLNTEDSLDGGAGTADTLNYVSTSAVAMAPANLTGIEVINARAVGNAISSTNLALYSGLTTFNSDRSDSSITVTGMAPGGSFGIIGNSVVTHTNTLAFGSAATTAQTLNIMNGTLGAFAVTLTGATSGTATVNSTGASNTIGALTLSAASTALTVNATNNLTAGVVTAAGVKTVTLTGAGAVTADLNAVAATKLVLSGSGAVNIGVLNNALVTVDASAHTGSFITTLGTSTAMVYTGGSGNDTVSAGAILGTGAAVNGGTGAGVDTVIFTANGQLTAGSGAKYTNFEILNAATGVTDINMDNIAGITSINLAGANTLTNVTATQAGAITHLASGALDIGVKGSTTIGQLDTVTITTVSANTAIAIATLAVAGVETVNLVAKTGTGLTSITSFGHADWSVLNLSGASAITVNSSATAALANTIVNGSAATGVLTLNFAASTTKGIAITGGSGADVLTGGVSADVIIGGGGIDTIVGGGGADTITGGDGADVITGGVGLDTMTGGEGADKYIFDAAAAANNMANIGEFDTITDFVVGTDKLSFASVTDVVSGQQTAVQAAVTALSANATAANIATAMALANTTNLAVSFATFGGSTYVLYETTGNGADFVVADDIFIKLTGVTTIPTFAADVVA